MDPLEQAELYPTALVEHPYRTLDELIQNGLRMEALDEMERTIRYVLDVNEDLSLLTSGIFRHSMFGALADLAGSSVLSRLFDSDLTPGSLLDMKLSIQSALRAPSTIHIESRVKRHGDTLAFVSTRFYTDNKAIAQAKTTHYIAELREPSIIVLK